MRTLTVLVLVAAIVMLHAAGCQQRQPADGRVEASRPVAPRRRAVALRRELREAVRQAARGKPFPQRKTAVADAAKRVFADRKMEDFTVQRVEIALKGDRIESVGWERPGHEGGVEVSEGVFHVLGYNYQWRLRPVVKDGQVTEVHVEASPICMW